VFLGVLSREQQELFMSAARRMADADGDSPSVEQALLDALLAECGLEEMPPLIQLDEVTERIGDAFNEDPHRRNAFMLELAGVVAIDGALHQAELDVLQRLGEASGLPADSLDSFLRFGMKARDLVVEGEQLIATTGADR
jgi:hypothetical protein